MAGTNYFGAGIGAFYYHKQSLADGGYDYYGRIHVSGKVLIMRQDVVTKDADYADGGWNFAVAWAGRAGLTYKNIDQL